VNDGDDELTPPRARPRRYAMGDDERSRRMSDSERGRRVHGVPVTRQPDEDSDTSPIDLLDREPDEQVREVVRRSRRESGAPATVEDIVALKLSWERAKAREKSSISEAQRVIGMLPSPDELRQLRSDVSLGKKIAIAVLLAVLGTVGTVAKGLYDRGGHDTAVDLRIERLERDIEHIERMSERDDRERRVSAPPPLPTQKGQTP